MTSSADACAAENCQHPAATINESKRRGKPAARAALLPGMLMTNFLC
jgi:hypothetical protein